MRLLETDPDVVDHLVRRKASQYSLVSATCLSDFCVLSVGLCVSRQSNPTLLYFKVKQSICHLFCSCSDPTLLRTEESYSLAGRSLSNDSFKASSGEVSPYDNNSPILSDQLLCKYGEDSTFSDRVSRASRSTSPKHDGEFNSFQLELFYKVWFRGLVWQLNAVSCFCCDLYETIDTTVPLYGQCEAGPGRQQPEILQIERNQ